MAPCVPQAVAALPGRHTCEASQQPEQLLESQAVGGALQTPDMAHEAGAWQETHLCPSRPQAFVAVPG